MKKINRKKIIWIEKRNQKLMYKRAKKQKRMKKGIPTSSSQNHHPQRSGNTFHLPAPEHFSLLDYTDETLKYFKKVQDIIGKASPGDTLFFDFTNIKTASPDAFMYIVALIHNNRKLRTFDIDCRGNEPIEEEPRKTLNQAGFFQYVHSRAFHPQEKEDALLRIYRGTTPDPEFAGKLCNFVHRRTSSEIDRIQTKRLYAMLIELMSNTKQHAFMDDSPYDSDFRNWYAFAEDLGDVIRFVFLDTGAGIPTTIRKNFYEKIPLLSSDSMFISSALKGAFRTDTGEKHRGKGLPEIYGSVKSDAIQSLTIFSAKGLCFTESNYEISERNLRISFDGTLFSWTIKKGCKDDDN